MSALTTQCPQCHTRFRVTEAQLLAHQGMVRCGRCNHIFNATTNGADDPHNSSLSEPITPPETGVVNEAADSLDFVHPAQAQGKERPANAEQASPPPVGEAAKVASAQQHEASTAVEAHAEHRIMPLAAPTLAQQVRFVADEETNNEPAPSRTWAWLSAALLLFAVVLLQAAYFFRVELAAQLPGLKPALTQYCDLLHCTITLPQKADLMSIEASDLEADRAIANAITVNILLRNRAPYTQAYPHLELTLTDVEDKPIARRIFTPQDYLKAAEGKQQGLSPSREQSIKLHLDTADLKASGYRLFLFYPQ